MNCGSCRYWTAQREQLGVCKRLPPVPVPTIEVNQITGAASPSIVSVFPMVGSADGCGEWKNKEIV